MKYISNTKYNIQSRVHWGWWDDAFLKLCTAGPSRQLETIVSQSRYSQSVWNSGALYKMWLLCRYMNISTQHQTSTDRAQNSCHLTAGSAGSGSNPDFNFRIVTSHSPRHGHVWSQVDGGVPHHIPGHPEEQEAPLRCLHHQRGSDWRGDGEFYLSMHGWVSVIILYVYYKINF